MKSWPGTVVPTLAQERVLPVLGLTDSKSLKLQDVKVKDVYRMYVCGITPYDATHLGHAATYLTFDLINRYLRAQGSTVKYVQNITDIDDPLLERAKRDKVDWQELALSQIDLFRSDMVNLRILPPDHYIGAVEAIDLVTQSISVLQEAGSIYPIDNDLYFKNYSSSEFGKLSHLNKAEMAKIFSERGGDPTLTGKIDPLDCLVWMAKREDEPGWQSIHGLGRPGWHIECTAIALKYLQPLADELTCIDIQGGGSDLIFPHHEMCASQARVITGKELAEHYVHSAMIGLDGEKMSKSKGNLVFVSTLVNSGVDPMAIRFALMSDHYRNDRMWSQTVLELAQNRIALIKQAIMSKNCAPTETVISEIISWLAQDLNTSNALNSVDKWAAATLAGANGGDKRELLTTLDALLGLSF